MADGKLLGISLSFWDETVGVFEPAKILRLVGRTFPGAEIDWTDRQRDRLLHELEYWSQQILDQERRETLVRQSWGTYQTNGPTYRFVVPLPSGLQCEWRCGRERARGSRRKRRRVKGSPGSANDARGTEGSP